jgi:hypothetical protein
MFSPAGIANVQSPVARRLMGSAWMQTSALRHETGCDWKTLSVCGATCSCNRTSVGIAGWTAPISAKAAHFHLFLLWSRLPALTFIMLVDRRRRRLSGFGGDGGLLRFYRCGCLNAGN